MDILDLPWLAGPLARLDARLARDRSPQALLVHGPAGVGRRHLALHLAARLLSLPPDSAPPDDGGTLPRWPHPDFWPLTFEEGSERKVILVEQVRELIAALALTSHRGQRRVGVVYPAEALHPAAANALLKTLEEPPPALTLILVSASTARLPATVVSRCERIRISIPDTKLALSWLAHYNPDGSACARALRFAGGAPLAARALLAGDTPELLSSIARDLACLTSSRTPPTEVARRWAKSGQDPDLYLRCLYLHTAALIRRHLAREEVALPDAGSPRVILPLKNPGSPRNMPDCCIYLDQLGEARRLKDRALNMEAMFAELLAWWYGGAGTAGS